jgi:hypothetical protein
LIGAKKNDSGRKQAAEIVKKFFLGVEFVEILAGWFINYGIADYPVAAPFRKNQQKLNLKVKMPEKNKGQYLLLWM